MVKKIVIALLSLWGITAKAQVVPNVDWAQYYSNRNFMDNVPTAIDVNSKVYTTGWTHNGSNKDLVVLCYDSLGTLVWSDSYATSGDDYGTSIRVDASGNTYVTGVSYSSLGGVDVVTIMYDNLGNRLWDQLYDRNNDVDEGADIQFDGTYIYVFCSTTNGNPDRDLTFLKYDLSGNLVTTPFHYDPYGYDDFAVGFVISGTGDLHAVSNTSNGTNLNVHGIRLYNTIAGVVSSNVFSGTGSGDNKATGIIIDSNDDLIISGSLNNSSTNDDYFTIKTDKNFIAYWQQDYDVANGYESATSLARDSANNIAVTGFVNNGGIYEYHTLMYSSSGTQLFTNIENTGIAGLYIKPRVAFDTVAHHIYVSGAKANASNDVFVYQIAPSGNTKWRKSFDGMANGHDAGTGMAVSGLGFIYLTALTTNTATGLDITTIKLSQTPFYFPPDLNGDSADLAFQYWENKGQLLDYTVNPVPQIKYYTMSQNPRVYIENLKNYFVYTRGDTVQSTYDTIVRVDMEFVKGNPLCDFFQSQETDGYANFFLSHLSSGITGLKGSKRMMVPNIWPNVDLHYYSNKDCIKYYFVLKQGLANLESVKLKFAGQNNDGIINHKLYNDCFVDSLIFSRPQVFQVDTSMSIITSGTGIWKNTIGSEYTVDSLTNMVPFWPIVIQVDVNKVPSPTAPPTTGINWSTFMQNGTVDEIRVSNKTGKQYITGSTSDPNFPVTTNGLFTSLNTSNFVDAFIVQLNKNNVRDWATYYGGTGSALYRSADYGTGIDFDTLGNVYVGGYTYSDSIPTWPSSNPSAYFQSKMKYPTSGTTNQADAFLLKLDSTGNKLTGHATWCTMLGGERGEGINDIRYQNGFIYAVADGGKINFATPAYSTPYQFKAGAFNQDTASGVHGSIFKFSDQCIYDWGTPFKQEGTHSGSVYILINACDVYDLGGALKSSSSTSNNGLVITGYAANSPDFPKTTVGANLPTAGYGSGDEAYLTIFDANDNIAYSTFIGGSDQDRGYDVVCHKAKAYVVGYGGSFLSNPTVKFPFKYAPGEYIDTTGSHSFISEFNVSDGLLKWSTLYDGDMFNSVCTDINGMVYVHGTITNGNGTITVPTFPSTLYSQAWAGTGQETFVTSFGSRVLKWSTYFGGTGQDQAQAISAYRDKDIYVIGKGSYASNSFPTFPGNTGGYFSTTGDMYVSRLGISPFYVGIKELAESRKLDNVIIYPNPTRENINIKLQDFKNNCNLDIYNSIGQLVHSSVLEQNESTVNTENLKAGLYIIKVTDKEKSYSGKFIKQ